jgi:hypothetical protein
MDPGDARGAILGTVEESRERWLRIRRHLVRQRHPLAVRAVRLDHRPGRREPMAWHPGAVLLF